MENLRGSLLMVGAMLGFALEDMFMKRLTAELPVGQMMIVLGALGAAIFAVAALARGENPFTRRLLTGPVIWRSLSEFVATMFYISAIAFTPLAQASAIQQAAPLAVTLGAALFLKETVGWRRWLAIALGFTGVMIVIQPGTTGFSVLSLLSVISVIWISARDLITRRIGRGVTSLQLATWGFAAIVPAGPIMLWVLGDHLVAMSALHWAMIVGATLFGAAAYYMLIASVRIGEMSFITPFRYTRLIFAVAIGWAVFREPPGPATLIGGAVIVASGLYSIWREAVRRR